ncbi:hypothetical protein [Rhodopila globiformis]|uniref:Uncharacterized protein n=1 Tax=Rhodopila globiformis TaxID=1071 RepID=A0A2S6N3X9_RHOGL|nr:hypothetical protein [Rhodopila globiformis]PPQ29331.1 hypothetical protein CCS01_21895 [Rhodopila globiformis]
MDKKPPPDLEMTLEGEFVSPPTPPLTTRIMFWAVVTAAIAGAVCIAALALWVALSVLPIVLGALVVAYVVYRYRLWRAGISVGRQPDLWRP